MNGLWRRIMPDETGRGYLSFNSVWNIRNNKGTEWDTSNYIILTCFLTGSPVELDGMTSTTDSPNTELVSPPEVLELPSREVLLPVGGEKVFFLALYVWKVNTNSEKSFSRWQYLQMIYGTCFVLDNYTIFWLISVQKSDIWLECM